MAQPGLRKLPIGVQDFPSLREDGYLYVDKTALVHELATKGRVYFLSRPRRFGKSLLLSTLGAYFEGRRGLFEGLAIAGLESEWAAHPVLRLDLNAEKYDSVDGLRSILVRHLREWERRFGEGHPDESLASRFLGVIQRAHEQTGRRVVVLVDEYDKPLLSVIGQPELTQAYKLELKAFYGVLKSADAWLRFAMLTGVTKFGQVSVFSDLNQLLDLSLHPRYATLCGITEEELVATFGPELEELARLNRLSHDECLDRVRRRYDGYRFEENAARVYNPFSTLNLFDCFKFQDFWFQTGTPTFLVELLKRSDMDLRNLEGVVLAPQDFANYRADPDRPLPVIYQSGYLTIRDYDAELGLYTLGYPNEEVRGGFLHFLLPFYTGIVEGNGGMQIVAFTQELRAGDVDAFLGRLRGFFAGIPYELSDQSERHYQVVFYLVFALMGQIVQAEVRSAKGRADAVVWTRERVFVFEFKLSGTAEEALAQIDAQGYAIPYEVGARAVVKVGVEFDKASRNIGRWLVG